MRDRTRSREPINTALQLAQPGGRVVLLASTRGETRVNSYHDVHTKEMSVIGAHDGAQPQRDSRPRVWTRSSPITCPATTRLIAMSC